MIGVLAKNSETETLAEFFELFKTPWEIYDQNKKYDVLMITLENIDTSNAGLIIIYNSRQTTFDTSEDITISPLDKHVFIRYEESQIPVYGNISTVIGKGQQLLPINNNRDKQQLKLKKPIKQSFALDMICSTRYRFCSHPDSLRKMRLFLRLICIFQSCEI